MVVLFVVFTIVLFVTIDYFIQKKRKIGLAANPSVKTLPLSKVFALIPGGVFLQNSFTWSKILDSGNLMIGIHPVLLGLVGEPDEIEMLHSGQNVRKGEILLKIHKGSKILNVKSPVDGEITAINQAVLADSTWDQLSQNWLYSLKPTGVSSEIPNWFVAEKANEWVRSRYEQLKNFFMSTTAPDTSLGYTMADGGDLPVGILSEFDERTWKKFEQDFIG